MIEGKTKSGFKFKIDERILSDWRLVDAIGLSESDDASEQIRGVRNLVQLVLGEQTDALKKHIADSNDGYVPMEKMTDIITEIITTSKELKNS
jgi:hypothetical protein